MSMPGVKASESELRERLAAIVRATPPLMQVLSVARYLCLSDWLVFSGAVYQPVLNRLTGRPLDFGIKDYDLGYFDASDLSYEVEDAVIRRRRTGRSRPLLRLWSASPRQHSRSASDWNPTNGSISRLPSVSPICSRCACVPTLVERRSVSLGPLGMCDAAGLKS